ncbi:unnamed protein product [Microthlaspi erraticum]|uniref:Uncharacterized protein n=1 Tax=Microthlaspi erraticum TaxID=1685480 RepID=A0A6D2IA90_9BRAS|nr:unnamed protein product [Microthlaspi erraticum]
MWNLKIPSELLQEILSRLGLKANMNASLVCKAWLKSSVSVRKLQPHPWLFYPLEKWSPTGPTYILTDTLRSQTRELDLPELRGHGFSHSKDGWLLVTLQNSEAFFLNPFTLEHIYLPQASPDFSGYCLAFSSAPTSPSCVVVDTWQPVPVATSGFSTRLEQRGTFFQWNPALPLIVAGQYTCGQ